uniref:DYW domain-containing protein n=1 Tax=Oryza punctata TaxID=4537 RepID=A0A0E0LGB6_ORYPU
MSAAAAVVQPVLPSSSASTGVQQHGVLTADRVAGLLTGCATLHRTGELHAAAVRAGVDGDRAVDFRLQRAYAASGRLDLAVTLLRLTPDPTTVFYTSAIHAHSSRGLHLAALALLSEMLGRGLIPTSHTLSSSLPACHGLALGRALHAYAFKLALAGDSYVATALLGMYARGGDADAARALFDEMPDPHVVSVTAMLTCYAKMGALDDARELSMMKASGIQKEPGCSAVEVGRKVYEFVAGDMSHPRTDEIYSMLERMNELVKEQGHVPQTELVLHDLDEASKEKALAVHSEKLAVAFGLISTAPGETIKIVKNLRACSDCHAVLKLISKITGRKIVFRDRNRFHHFVDGSCTCGDYW